MVIYLVLWVEVGQLVAACDLIGPEHFRVAERVCRFPPRSRQTSATPPHRLGQMALEKKVVKQDV